MAAKRLRRALRKCPKADRPKKADAASERAPDSHPNELYSLTEMIAMKSDIRESDDTINQVTGLISSSCPCPIFPGMRHQ
jgi:hypothetical protein